MGTLNRVQNTDRFWIDPDTGIYYIEIYVDSERRRLSTGERDLENARKKRREIERTAKEKFKKKRSNLAPTFENEWDMWVERKKSIWKPGTYADVKSRGKCHLKEYFGSYRLDEISTEAWDKYVSFKLKNNPSMTLAKHKTYLSMFLNDMLRADKIIKLPRLYDPDDDSDAAVVISLEEEREILKNLSGDMRLGFLMGIRLGMRQYEIFGLKKDRIDTKEWFIRLKATDTKTGKARAVPVIDSEIREEILLRMKTDSLFLFPSPKNKNESRWFPKNEWDDVREKTGVDVTFHNTRHTAASRFAEQMSPTIASRILGMSITIYDKKYCRVKDADLMKAMAISSQNIAIYRHKEATNA